MSHPNEGVRPRTREYAWRSLCVRADSEFVRESEVVIEYEFYNKTRIFEARYKQRGIYAS